MATKDSIEIDVQVGEGINSIKRLKDASKELGDRVEDATLQFLEMSNQFGKSSDQAALAKQRLESYNTQLNEVNAKISEVQKGHAAVGNIVKGLASGFQLATGAAALFNAESEDVNKALMKVQSAMALAEGVKGLGGMKESFADAGKFAKQLVTQLIGVDTYTKIVTVSTRIWNAVMAMNPIMLIVAGIGLLVGAFVALDKAFADNRTEAEKLEDAYQDQKKASEEIIKSIDNEITALSGLKSNEEEILKLRKQRIEQSLELAKVGREAAAAQVAQDEKELGFLDEITASVSELMGKEGARHILTKKNSAESRKLLEERTAEEKKAAAELSQFENEQKQKQIDKNKAASDKAKAEEQAAKDLQQKINELEWEENQKRLKADIDAREAAAQQEIEDFEYNEKLKADIEEDARVRRAEKRLKELEQAKKDREESNKAIQEAEEKSIEAMQGLSAGFFAFKLRAAKGNAAEELKIRKQQFAVDKAFNLARAIQDGIRSVQAALTIPPPGGQILAGVNAAIAAGNVAKIAASQFEGGSTGDIGNVNVSTPGTFTQAPNVGSNQNQTQLNTDGSVNKQGQSAVIKAYVVESESAAVTKRVNKLTEQSKI